MDANSPIGTASRKIAKLLAKSYRDERWEKEMERALYSYAHAIANQVGANGVQSN